MRQNEDCEQKMNNNRLIVIIFSIRTSEMNELISTHKKSKRK